MFGLRSLSTASTLRTLRQMLSRGTEPPRGRGMVARHDLAELTLEADRPVAFQIDGEYVGERERVRFRAVPACAAGRDVTTRQVISRALGEFRRFPAWPPTARQPG